MISEKDVNHIAGLARLGLTSSEVKKFQKDLSSILGYIEKLKKANVKTVRNIDQSPSLKNVMRDDVAVKQSEDVTNKIIGLMPDTKERFLKVKSIF
ncbi:MAG: hypothetical protein A3H01_01065 [Candidatus Wildermuthbacteria bacterium RIFCSPLOWO2_12_FULL_40_9]|uniref:Aspartyl/glutamyl-tRNA(Asn/Gln) amidotransferase subunit C n=2 Tax=Candidatus Wildermuthiibacteriota TaxID=1817923 RepID=A0A1G2RF68_9BACT|nr:MAG: hypothetical protein A3F15_00615 [Candidatus Wildermuthbacteria bacterium RIFCSPHIGHO2_12_FULL_40_12]OHA76645.1 MAG: hypothetical protein A3H01_01065 [Candidatus Wildermuthbacteria bacterium RIFCSPLOWO2_12_FULL_40_9]